MEDKNTISQTEAQETFGVSRYAFKSAITEHGEGGLDWLVRDKHGKLAVDTSAPGWLEWVAAVHQKGKAKKLGVKTPLKSAQVDKSLERLEKRSIKAQLEMPIIKRDHEKVKAKTAEKKLRRLEGDDIPFRLAEVSFFGFADRLSVEVLRTETKLRKRIRDGVAALLVQRIADANLPPEVDEAVREFLKGSDVLAMSTELGKMVTQEIQETVRTVKKDQRDAIEKWREEELGE